MNQMRNKPCSLHAWTRPTGGVHPEPLARESVWRLQSASLTRLRLGWVHPSITATVPSSRSSLALCRTSNAHPHATGQLPHGPFPQGWRPTEDIRLHQRIQASHHAAGTHTGSIRWSCEASRANGGIYTAMARWRHLHRHRARPLL